MSRDSTGAREARLDAVLAEFLDAPRADGTYDWQLLLDRHPDLRDELVEFIQDHDEMYRIAQPLRPADVNTGEADSASSTHSTPVVAREESSEPMPHAIGSYQVLDEIGRGGMGVVYRAHDAKTNRVVALKMIRGSGDDHVEDLARFRREAEEVARLEHPNIVPIYDAGDLGGHPYYTMRCFEAGTLGNRLDHYRNHRTAGALLLAKIARALQFVHDHGIIHRDLKPGNILLAPIPDADPTEFEPYLADFGLARMIREDQSLTRSGTIIGTPGYMAPEQALGERHNLTPAADVFSLGAILYHMIAGKRPFEAEDPVHALLLLHTADPVPPRSLDPSIDRDLQTICLKCLEKEPQRRYASARAAAEDLERWLRAEPILAKPIGGIERLWRSVRRRPAMSLGTLSILLLLCIAGLLLRESLRVPEIRREPRVRPDAASQAAFERDNYIEKIAQAQAKFDAGRIVEAESLLHGCPASQRHWEWHHLTRLTQGDAIAEFKASPLRGFDFNDNGTEMALRDQQAILILRPSDGKRLRTFKDIPGSRVLYVRDRLVVMDGDALAIHSAHTGMPIKSLRLEGAVLDWTKHPKEPSVATCGDDLCLWDIATGARLKRIAQPAERVAMCRNWLALLTGGDVQIWNSATLANERIWPTQALYVAMAGTSTIALLTTAGIEVRDARDGTVLAVIDAPDVTALALSPDGMRLATIDTSSNVTLRETATGQVLLRRKVESARGVQRLAFGAKGDLALLTEDRVFLLRGALR